MRIIPTAILFALCLALFVGACWARGTTVSVGETVPLGGTTTVTTTTTNTTTTTHEGSSEPIPQVTITPADGGTAPPAEGSSWGDLGMIGSGNSSEASSGSAAADGATGDGGTSPPAQQNPTGQGTSSGCMPAFVLAGIGLSLFAFKN